MHNQLKWNKGIYQEGRLEFTTPDPQYTHSYFPTHAYKRTRSHSHSVTLLAAVTYRHSETHNGQG